MATLDKLIKARESNRAIDLLLREVAAKLWEAIDLIQDGTDDGLELIKSAILQLGYSREDCL